MQPDECGTDCRAIARAGLNAMPSDMWSLMWSGRLEQTCECGKREPAGGFCSDCGHYPNPAKYHVRTITEAQRAARMARRGFMDTPSRPAVRLRAA